MQELTSRQQEIIAKSLVLIAERGIQNLTIKNIAREMGVTEPALYRHFPSKFALMDAMLDSFEEDSERVLEAVERSPGGGMDHISAFIRDRFDRIAANPALAKVIFSEELFRDDPRLANKIRKQLHGHKVQILAIIEAGQGAGTIRADIASLELFRIIFGPVRLLIKQWALSQEAFNLHEKGEHLLEALHKLLSTKPA